MSTLAVRLDELAQANSDGLLNDDEYRVLRQDLFLRYASTNEPLVETPLIPSLSTANNYPYPSLIGAVEVSFNSLPTRANSSAGRPSIGHRQWGSHSSSNTPSPHASPSPPSPLLSKKPSTNLFTRRASVKKDGPEPTSSKEKKRAFIPRIILSEKTTSATHPPPLSPSVSSVSSSTNSPRTPTSTRISPHSLSPRPSLALTSSSRSMSRASKRRPDAETSGSSAMLQLPSASSEIFDDSNLGSASAIQSTINTTHVELRNLIEMFDQMEEGVIERLADLRDKLGVRASLIELATTSSTLGSPQPAVRRKASLSSLSSLATSSFTNISATLRSKSSLSPPPTISRSRSPSIADELATEPPVRRSATLRPVRSAQTLGRQRSVRSPVPFSAVDEDVELTEMLQASSLEEKERDTIRSMRKELKDVRKRKEEVTWRYEARMEYLRARLKGAELGGETI
ncbi:hypothetical protein DL96DRAFT_1587589 [Flagelloscypha sp. PMI_526]|nr:hypothetical protein DL96DRAFT_1587589 [Flagelloscypha sp. PMI_526]